MPPLLRFALLLCARLQSPVDCLYDPSQPIKLSVTVMPKYTVDFPNPVSFYVEVSQGGYPLLGLEVAALIKRPSRPGALPLPLRDDGRLTDKLQKDGIYSAKFFDFTAAGAYSYSFTVQGELVEMGVAEVAVTVVTAVLIAVSVAMVVIALSSWD